MKKYLLFPVYLLMSIFIITGCSSKELTVTINKDNGEEATKLIVLKNELVSMPEQPIKNGYMFIYWVNESEEKFDFNIPIKKDTTIKALWVKEFYNFIVDTHEDKQNPLIYRLGVLKNNDIYRVAKQLYDKNGKVIPQLLPISHDGYFYISADEISNVAKVEIENGEIYDITRTSLVQNLEKE